MRTQDVLAIIRGDPKTVVPYSPWILLGGMAVVAASYLGDGAGLISGFFCAALGAAGGSLVNWQRERGLWMLAGVFLVMFSAVYLLSCCGQLADVWRGAKPADLAVSVDFVVGTLLLSAMLRFLVTVARDNYSNRSQGEGS